MTAVAASSGRCGPLINTPNTSERLFSRFLFADEFVSLTIESYTYEMLETLARRAAAPSMPIKPQLLELARSEIAYRRKTVSVDSGRSQRQRDPRVPQERAQEVRRERSVSHHADEARGRLVEQTIYAIAAGLAMLFATGVAFISQRRYGNLTLPFFVALVISYMFKDRIKEILRGILNTRVAPFLLRPTLADLR